MLAAGIKLFFIALEAVTETLQEIVTFFIYKYSYLRTIIILYCY